MLAHNRLKRKSSKEPELNLKIQYLGSWVQGRLLLILINPLYTACVTKIQTAANFRLRDLLQFGDAVPTGAASCRSHTRNQTATV
jgi:hypothetical protein